MNFSTIAKMVLFALSLTLFVWFVVPFLLQFIAYPEPESATAFRAEYRRDYLPLMGAIGALIFALSILVKRPGS